MEIDDCYRVLRLPHDASLDEIKSAYRRLSLKYHPDVNQSDPKATEKFRQVKEAYDILKQVALKKTPTESKEQKTEGRVRVKYKPRANATSYYTHYTSKTNNRSQDLKQKLKLVQNLIQEKSYYHAVWLVEELRRCYPNDPEVAHWQAIAYYHRGNELLQQYRYIQAREYLTKALYADPQNHELCFMAKRALDRINEVRVVANRASFYGDLTAGIISVIVLIALVTLFHLEVFPALTIIYLIFLGICVTTPFIIGIIGSCMNIAFGKSARFNKK